MLAHVVFLWTQPPCILIPILFGGSSFFILFPAQAPQSQSGVGMRYVPSTCNCRCRSLFRFYSDYTACNPFDPNPPYDNDHPFSHGHRFCLDLLFFHGHRLFNSNFFCRCLAFSFHLPPCYGWSCTTVFNVVFLFKNNRFFVLSSASWSCFPVRTAFRRLSTVFLLPNSLFFLNVAGRESGTALLSKGFTAHVESFQSVKF